MLATADRVPAEVRVWLRPGGDPVPLADALGDGPVLLLFYLLDWSFT